jgi:hypothetical protein
VDDVEHSQEMKWNVSCLDDDDVYIALFIAIICVSLTLVLSGCVILIHSFLSKNILIRQFFFSYLII